jgi:hypothetical protein
MLGMNISATEFSYSLLFQNGSQTVKEHPVKNGEGYRYKNSIAEMWI